MTPEMWKKVRRVVDAAEGVEAAKLSGFLDRECGDDSALRAEVDSLLEMEPGLDGFITEPAFGHFLPSPAESSPAEPPRDLVGQEIGPFRLMRLLGRGGMGDVYLAERTADFQQRVALKVVQTRLVREALVRRFHAERQILARLEHPNIARLIDGGTTRGLPWFAMELVEGQPIDQWADAHGAGVEQRLHLFLRVCAALQWAHRNLVIHRDLKPGNILVDAEGTPKLLDFGIAKLLDAEDSASVQVTGDGPNPMTLAYASPEQLSGEPLGTTSDIYSLGVVLYRLLARRPPHSLEGLSPIERMRAVCEDDPPPPSLAVDPTAEAPTAAAAIPPGGPPADADGEPEGGPRSTARERPTGGTNLRRALRGDLDAIVMKALRKEPEARYATVNQLADDIRRHLDGLPVSAHQGTFGYRWGKLLRRYRWRFAAAAAIVVLVIGFTIALAAQLRNTRQERDKATTVSTFMIDLFEGADPDRRGETPPTVLELVEQGRLNLEGGLESAPEARIELQRTLGVVYGKLGRYDSSLELLGEAVDALRREHRRDHPDLARALNDLATVHNWRGDLDSAVGLYRESIDMRRRLGLDDELPKPMSNFASILLARGELEEAEAIYRAILERRREEMGPDHRNVASSLRSLATVLYSRGRVDEAEPLLREALEIRRAAFGDGSPRVATVLGSLGRVAQARGQLDEAEVHYSRALEIRRERLGEDHLHTAIAKRDLASLLVDRGELETARVLIAQALEGLYRIRGQDDVYVAEAEAVLGLLFEADGDLPSARVCLEHSLGIIEAQRGPDAFRARRVREHLEALGSGRRGGELPEGDLPEGDLSEAGGAGHESTGPEQAAGVERRNRR